MTNLKWLVIGGLLLLGIAALAFSLRRPVVVSAPNPRGGSYKKSAPGTYEYTTPGAPNK